jgi:hypothetical protein
MQCLVLGLRRQGILISNHTRLSLKEEFISRKVRVLLTDGRKKQSGQRQQMSTSSLYVASSK